MRSTLAVVLALCLLNTFTNAQSYGNPSGTSSSSSYTAPSSTSTYTAPSSTSTYTAPSNAYNSSYTAPSNAYNSSYTAPSNAYNSSYTAPSNAYNSSYTAPSNSYNSSYTAPSNSYNSSYTAPSNAYNSSYSSSNYSPYNSPESYAQTYGSYVTSSYNYNSPSYTTSSMNTSSYSNGGTSYSSSNSQPSSSSYTAYTAPYDQSVSSQVPMFPTSIMTGFVVDVHFLAVDASVQYIAYHYCSDLFPGYSQCAIFNGTEENARFIAVEIVVSAEVLATLPMDERALWHSHSFAVTSGLLVLPGVTADQELSSLQGIINTYGKVCDFYHSFESFPLGPPQLAYAVSDESQFNADMADLLDSTLKLSTTWQQRQQQRKSLTVPTLIAGVNGYMTSGKYQQYVVENFTLESNS